MRMYRLIDKEVGEYFLNLLQDLSLSLPSSEPLQS